MDKVPVDLIKNSGGKKRERKYIYIIKFIYKNLWLLCRTGSSRVNADIGILKQSDFLGSRTLTVDQTALIFRNKMAAQSPILTVNASITMYLHIVAIRCFYIKVNRRF